jgi:hypothetical protein
VNGSYWESRLTAPGPIPEVERLPIEQNMLSFEVIKSGKAIQIYADDEGLSVLMAK